ncbi:uncharacterized protein DNG_00856 [Cephalotrichum gorgonifer]|uniref:C2H2-type domain-containing protein n=1 Tax=Cephalotrichum gorgonifer TaxID=2041049 RepID=A0AAE8MQ10_9PEZI|nr:uncharacterized protein DNG_00856 [Cephalotrichum gorgonifer]
MEHSMSYEGFEEQYFSPENPNWFRSSQRFEPVHNLSSMHSTETGYHESHDYSQFRASQHLKQHPGHSPGLSETAYYPPQYTDPYLGPVSPDQAFSSAGHSPQIESGPYSYESRSHGNTLGMASPTPAYEYRDQEPYQQQDYSQASFVNMSDVNHDLPLEFGGERMGVSGFSVSFDSGHTSSEAMDVDMNPYPVEDTYYDLGLRGTEMTPPEEDDLDQGHARAHLPQRKNGRTDRGRKQTPPTNNKQASKPVPKKSKTDRPPTRPSVDNAPPQEASQQAHTRPLICVFGYAGCTTTFGSKNEWKRHVLSQHIMLSYWLCTDIACARANPQSGGTVFNRKDLYTQHVRRMHVPDMYKDAVSNKTHEPGWDRMLRTMQDEAEQKRCEMPIYMECPSAGCNVVFKGTSSWDDRMEHVAKHLATSEPRVVFGGDSDKTLTDWAERPDVNIVRRVGRGDRWELAMPLKTTAKELGSARKVAAPSRLVDSDEDGDGELE